MNAATVLGFKLWGG